MDSATFTQLVINAHVTQNTSKPRDPILGSEIRPFDQFLNRRALDNENIIVTMNREVILFAFLKAIYFTLFGLSYSPTSGAFGMLPRYRKSCTTAPEHRRGLMPRSETPQLLAVCG